MARTKFPPEPPKPRCQGIPRVGTGLPGPGRLRKIQSVPQLIDQINAYFESCYDVRIVHEKDEEGNTITYEETYLARPFVMSGLAMYLGMSMDTLRNYSERDDQEGRSFFGPINQAKEIIHKFTEEQLHRKEQVTGVIFSIKNNFKQNWQDRTQQEISGPNGQPIGMSIEQNDAKAKATREAMLNSLPPLPSSIAPQQEPVE